jgi:hypothetical protein
MRLYPDLPRQRRATLAGDAALVLALLVLAWLAMWVHDAVLELTSVGRGVQEAGRSVESGFESAAGAVDGVPLVGEQLSGALRDTSGDTAGQAVEAGQGGGPGGHRPGEPARLAVLPGSRGAAPEPGPARPRAPGPPPHGRRPRPLPARRRRPPAAPGQPGGVRAPLRHAPAPHAGPARRPARGPPRRARGGRVRGRGARRSPSATARWSARGGCAPRAEPPGRTT